MRRTTLPALSLLAVSGLLHGCSGSREHGHDATPVRGSVSSTPQDRAIAQVISSPHGRGFGFFPHHVGRERCVIRGGSPAVRIRGVCSTHVIYSWGGGGPLVIFKGSWPWRSFHWAAAPRRPQRRSWRFAVGEHGRVRAVGQAGDFPPQYVKCVQARRPRVRPASRTSPGLICLLGLGRTTG